MKGIQIASKLEWETVIRYCSNPKVLDSPYGAYFLHKFPFWDEPAVIYYSGYSKVRASGAAQYMISRYGLETLIVAGSCGGVAEDLEHLDVIIGTETAIYDCIDRLELQQQLFHQDFRVKLDLSCICMERLPNKTKLGIIATADQDIDHQVRAMLQPEGVMAADWESGAIALVCQYNGVDAVVFRGVSDLPHEQLDQSQQADEYLTNTPFLMRRIFEEYLPLVK